MSKIAGLKVRRKNQVTGNMVGIYDGIAAGMDTTGGRWQTVCEKHGTIISHRTLALAYRHSSDAVNWCEDCQDKNTRE